VIDPRRLRRQLPHTVWNSTSNDLPRQGQAPEHGWFGLCLARLCRLAIMPHSRQKKKLTVEHAPPNMQDASPTPSTPPCFTISPSTNLIAYLLHHVLSSPPSLYPDFSKISRSLDELYLSAPSLLLAAPSTVTYQLALTRPR